MTGASGWGHSAREEVRTGVGANLASLGVDLVPVVNLRRHPESDVPFDEQLELMNSLRDEGIVGSVSVSNVDLEQYRVARSLTDLAWVQNAFNLADRTGQDVFEACRADGVPFVPFFPLGSAFHPENPVLGAPAVQDTAHRLDATPAQVALAWLLHRAATVLLVPGTSSVEHLEENLASAGLVLDGEAREALP
jgi:aryl-alcohol dehydrogenase-like predicted oxidoreductase